jgi:XTP/dITP diphosphohydrolase
MKELVIGTKNKSKLKEIKELLSGHFPQVFSDFHAQPIAELEETENTFIGNAQLKATALDRLLLNKDILSYAVLADDSGLCVDLLGGAPGIYSARYAGVGAKYSQMIEKLLSELKIKDPTLNLEKRSAHFRCALSFIIRVKEKSFLWNVEEKCEGHILTVPRGDEGFGYDPVFYVPSLSKSLAELSFDEKNKISHRSQAFLELKRKVASTLDLL